MFVRTVHDLTGGAGLFAGLCKRGYLVTPLTLQFLRHTFQSSKVTFCIALAALCSQRPLRRAKSFFTAPIALGLPK